MELNRQVSYESTATISSSNDEGLDSFIVVNSNENKSCPPVGEEFIAIPQEKMDVTACINMDAEYIKSIVFGGLDGICTTFAVISSINGSRGSLISSNMNGATAIIILLGLSNVLADGISMGFGDWISEKAEMDYAVEQHSKIHVNEGNKRMLRDALVETGLTLKVSESVVENISSSEEAFKDFCLMFKFGMMPVADDDASPLKKGIFCFLSFVFFGCLPLIAYAALWPVNSMSDQLRFWIAAIVAGCTCFSLGCLKGSFISKRWQVILEAGIWMIVNGSVSAAAAWLIGFALRSIIHVDL
eukprot:g2539.t1